MTKPQTKLDLQLHALRLAYRKAKTTEERESITKHAEMLKNPATPEETAELEAGAAALMELPDLSHPYWNKFR